LRLSFSENRELSGSPDGIPKRAGILGNPICAIDAAESINSKAVETARAAGAYQIRLAATFRPMR
jgi:hypothetical protein